MHLDGVGSGRLWPFHCGDDFILQTGGRGGHALLLAVLGEESLALLGGLRSALGFHRLHGSLELFHRTLEFFIGVFAGLLFDSVLETLLQGIVVGLETLATHVATDVATDEVGHFIERHGGHGITRGCRGGSSSRLGGVLSGGHKRGDRQSGHDSEEAWVHRGKRRRLDERGQSERRDSAISSQPPPPPKHECITNAWKTQSPML